MKLAKIMAERGHTDAHVARIVHTTAAAIAYYRRGKRVPRPEIELRLRAYSNGRVTAEHHYDAYALAHGLIASCADSAPKRPRVSARKIVAKIARPQLAKNWPRNEGQELAANSEACT